MQSITFNLESDLSPKYVEEWKEKVTAYAKKLARKYEKKEEPTLEDFFGMWPSDPELAKLSHKELKEMIMKERFGI